MSASSKTGLNDEKYMSIKYSANVRKFLRAAFLGTVALLMFSGCATQTAPVATKESQQSLTSQKAAQQVVAVAPAPKPTLKRKIALGRITNETTYGKSLLRDSVGDPLGKQVTDLLSKSLTESGSYIVLERPDISKLKEESNLTGVKLNLVGKMIILQFL